MPKNKGFLVNTKTAPEVYRVFGFKGADDFMTLRIPIYYYMHKKPTIWCELTVNRDEERYWVNIINEDGSAYGTYYNKTIISDVNDEINRNIQKLLKKLVDNKILRLVGKNGYKHNSRHSTVRTSN